jgi:arylsulfatase A-like enzyme
MKTFSLLALLLLLNGTMAQDAARPNFLFVISDDHRWDVLSVVQREQEAQGKIARFPWFKTPNLDKLASQGVRFRNAFVVNSLCSPSRAAFLTGRYNHFNGIANNFTPFSANNITWATELRKSGYATGYIGKWHMDSQKGQRPGFDYSASYIGHGRYNDCPFEINGVSQPAKGYVDDVSTDFAIDFFKKNKDKPWALVVGYKAPHADFTPPERLKNAFAGEQANAVPNLNSGPPYRDNWRVTQDTTPVGGKVPAHLNYMRCVAGVDDNVGRLMQALDEQGQSENTVVVYAGDNGFYLGEHRLGDKRSAYEESLRIPLIVRYPKLKLQNVTEDRMALNIDLAPTFLDFAGVAIPETMQGKSWRPLLEQKPKPILWRDRFFYEYFWEQQRGGSPPTLTALRTEKAKLIQYKDHPEWSELFDLSADPYETKNLYNDANYAALRREMESEHEKQKAAVGYVIPPYASDPEKIPPQIAQAINTWVLEFRFDKDGERILAAPTKLNAGAITHGAILGEGRDGKKALRLDGKSYLEVPKSEALRPDLRAWAIETTFKAEKPDGMLVARGGASNGYALFLEKGRPVFVITSANVSSRVTAPVDVTNRWITVSARLTNDKQLRISIDGQEVASAKAKDYIAADPREDMQIGADKGSQVVGAAIVPQFTGLIESLRLYSGALP